ncbi:hypothetical protein SEA_LITTLEFELLA_49 [Gordonia phage LittleFella]|nr:hypothetical protein SEA_LITTLEFELLA_49 [Gordonia phage LittleFella]
MASEDYDLQPERCLVCGEFIDYCLGHGGGLELVVWDQHEDGDHSNCNPLACEELR